MESMEGFQRRPGFLRRLARSRTALLGAAILVTVLVVAVLAPVLAPYDPVAMQTDQRLQPPSRDHLMGTDKYGRDVLSRVIWGARVSMTVAVSAVAGACARRPAGGLGAAAGTRPGHTRRHRLARLSQSAGRSSGRHAGRGASLSRSRRNATRQARSWEATNGRSE